MRRVLGQVYHDELMVVPQQNSVGHLAKDFHGRFIVRILFRRCGAGDIHDLGEELIRRGYAFLYPIFGLPRVYIEAAKHAKQNGLGLFQHPPEVLEAILPNKCREGSGEKGVALRQAGPFGSDCVIVTPPRICSEVLANERMLRVGESTIRGAGDGLFLKPQPRRIPRGTKLCLYMDKLFNSLSVVSSQDYTLEMRRRGKKKLLYADAEKCHDVFLGPKCNDKSFGSVFGRIDFGSLDCSVSATRGRRALGQAVTVHSLDTFFTEFRKVEEDVSNCHFSYDGPFTFLETTVDIPAHTSQELFVSYGISGYWIPKVQAALAKEPPFANDFEESLHHLGSNLRNCGGVSQRCKELFP
eukprot:gene6545-12029_t